MVSFCNTSTPLARAAKALGMTIFAQTAILIGHCVFGARLYEEPGRLHLVHPAIGLLIATIAVVRLFAWRPNKVLFGLVSLFVTVPYIGMFGLYHGFYSHLLKNAMFFAGASEETLEHLFMSPDYVLPNNAIFEISGIIGFVVTIFVSYRMVRLFKEWRNSQHDTACKAQAEAASN